MQRGVRSLALAMIAVFAGAVLSFAQTGQMEVPSITASPVTSRITLDGRLTEDVWNTATPVRNFRQRDPNEGQPVRTSISNRFG